MASDLHAFADIIIDTASSKNLRKSAVLRHRLTTQAGRTAGRREAKQSAWQQNGLPVTTDPGDDPVRERLETGFGYRA